MKILKVVAGLLLPFILFFPSAFIGFYLANFYVSFFICKNSISWACEESFFPNDLSIIIVIAIFLSIVFSFFLFRIFKITQKWMYAYLIVYCLISMILTLFFGKFFGLF